MSKFAVILIRGLIGVSKDKKETLFRLGLKKKHTCVILEDNPVNKGMLIKVKDYITFGEVSDETTNLLNEKKGDSKVYHLNPPKGGFERKGIKTPFTIGGALGYRGDKINELIKKMI